MPAIDDPYAPYLRMLLIFCRTGSFLAMTPLLRRLPVPPTAAVGLVLLVGYLIELAGLGPDVALLPGLQIPAIVALEVGIGLAMGFLTLVVFEAFRLAGQIIGFAMGLSAAQLLDPSEQSSMSAMSVAFNLFAGLLFILMDGHHMLLRTLVLSYELAPIGAAHFPTGAGHTLVSLLALSFALGVRIAAPILAGQMLTDVTAGIVGRSIQKIPIFFISLPVKILIAYGITIVTLPLLSLAVDGQIGVLERHIRMLLHGI
jgi:flagellar biosynthetic protein FliR